MNVYLNSTKKVATFGDNVVLGSINTDGGSLTITKDKLELTFKSVQETGSSLATSITDEILKVGAFCNYDITGAPETAFVNNFSYTYTSGKSSPYVEFYLSYSNIRAINSVSISITPENSSTSTTGVISNGSVAGTGQDRCLSFTYGNYEVKIYIYSGYVRLIRPASITSGDIIELTVNGTTTEALVSFVYGKRKTNSTYGQYSFTVGQSNQATGRNSIAMGGSCEANNIGAIAIGLYAVATGTYSHAEGAHTTASGDTSHAEGSYTIASGTYSHTEGSHTTASGTYSHAEGDNSIASGKNSHAEGTYSIASGDYSHAEGASTASGQFSHAEGYHTAASALAHAEGNVTTASGVSSHAQNEGTIADGDYMTAIGKYNTANSGKAFVIGNGAAEQRSDAFSVDWAGDVTIGGMSTPIFGVGTVITLDSACYTQGTGTATTISDASNYSTLKNPNDFGYPGTWKLMDKDMGYGSWTNAISIADTARVSSISAQWIVRGGKSFTVQCNFVNKDAHSDNPRQLIKVPFGTIGISRASYTAVYFQGNDDGQNGIAQLQMDAVTGVISEVDFISRATSIPTGVNGTTSMTLTMTVPCGYIYDSACNRFYWRRIA